MEDIWITGVLREKAGIPSTCVLDSWYKADLHTWGYKDQGDINSPCFMRKELDKFAREINKREHCRCNYSKLS